LLQSIFRLINTIANNIQGKIFYYKAIYKEAEYNNINHNLILAHSSIEDLETMYFH